MGRTNGSAASNRPLYERRTLAAGSIRTSMPGLRAPRGCRRAPVPSQQPAAPFRTVYLRPIPRTVVDMLQYRSLRTSSPTSSQDWGTVVVGIRRPALLACPRAICSALFFWSKEPREVQPPDTEPVPVPLGEWIEDYDNRASHLAFGMRSPAEYRTELQPSSPGV